MRGKINSLWASSAGRCGGVAGKGRRAYNCNFNSLRKHPFLLALRRWGRFARRRARSRPIATTSLELELHLPCGSPWTELSDLSQSQFPAPPPERPRELARWSTELTAMERLEISCTVYTVQASWRIVPRQCKGIQESLGFWMPRGGFRSHRYWIPEFLLVEHGFQTPIVSRIRNPSAVVRIPRPRMLDSTRKIC